MLAKQRAMAYLETHLNEVETPLSAAIVSYALALVNSDKKHVAIDKLLALAEHDEDTNRLYWQTPESAQDIETAGYALMALLLSKDMVRSNSIVNWLNTKQLQSGVLKSVQDTVVALQALSKYAIKTTTPVNLVSNITSSNDINFYKVLTFNEDNAFILQDARIDTVGGTIFIKTSGHGLATLTAKLRYNVIVPIEDICKFEVTVRVTEVKNFIPVRGARSDHRDTEPLAIAEMEKLRNDMHRRVKRQNPDGKDQYALNISLCVRYLGNNETGMSIVDVGTFSGFEPYTRDLKKLQDDANHLIKLYETSSRGVVFYLEKVPTAESYCFSYHVLRKFYVGNIQTSTIKVYDYYNPDETCTKFFRPDNGKPMLRTICEGERCECAQDGCPPEKPFRKYQAKSAAKNRENLISAFCETYDFVWKGQVKEQIKPVSDFLNITFQIDEVVKPGIEEKVDIEGETRTLLMRDSCTADFFLDVTYLIAGKDGKAYQNEREIIWYRYILDETSAVYLYSRHVGDQRLNRHLAYVTKSLSDKGCNL